MTRSRIITPLERPAFPGCTFDQASHTYTIDGQVVPSVTQVLNTVGFIDFSSVPTRILEEAQARGTYVHTVLHYHLEGDFDLRDVDERFRGYVDSALAYLESARLRPLTDAAGRPMAVEFRFWDGLWRTAGTIDYVAWDLDDVLAITDWKTGEPSDVAAPLQTAMYERGLRLALFPDMKFPIRRRAVKLFRDGKPGRVEPYDDPQDLALFRAALTCVHYRNRLQKAS